MSFGPFSFERDQNMLTAGCARKRGRPVLSRWSKAQLASFLTEFVDPRMGFALSSPFSRRKVDGLWFLSGVDGAGPLADLLAVRTNDSMCRQSR
jgi:hypothetical protein